MFLAAAQQALFRLYEIVAHREGPQIEIVVDPAFEFRLSAPKILLTAAPTVTSHHGANPASLRRGRGSSGETLVP